MLETVKLALRIKTDKLNSEIEDLIEACKMDLEISGVNKAKIVDDDALIKRCIIIYCKANFGLDNKDAWKYEKSYESLKAHLCLSGDYNV